MRMLMLYVCGVLYVCTMLCVSFLFHVIGHAMNIVCVCVCMYVCVCYVLCAYVLGGTESYEAYGAGGAAYITRVCGNIVQHRDLDTGTGHRNWAGDPHYTHAWCSCFCVFVRICFF